MMFSSRITIWRARGQSGHVDNPATGPRTALALQVVPLAGLWAISTAQSGLECGAGFMSVTIVVTAALVAAKAGFDILATGCGRQTDPVLDHRHVKSRAAHAIDLKQRTPDQERIGLIYFVCWHFLSCFLDSLPCGRGHIFVI